MSLHCDSVNSILATRKLREARPNHVAINLPLWTRLGLVSPLKPDQRSRQHAIMSPVDAEGTKNTERALDNLFDDDDDAEMMLIDTQHDSTDAMYPRRASRR